MAIAFTTNVLDSEYRPNIVYYTCRPSLYSVFLYTLTKPKRETYSHSDKAVDINDQTEPIENFVCYFVSYFKKSTIC